MIITQYICDNCGKKIEGNFYKLCLVDNETGHIVVANELDNHMHFCKDCINKLFNNTKNDTKQEKQNIFG